MKRGCLDALHSCFFFFISGFEAILSFFSTPTPHKNRRKKGVSFLFYHTLYPFFLYLFRLKYCFPCYLYGYHPFSLSFRGIKRRILNPNSNQICSLCVRKWGYVGFFFFLLLLLLWGWGEFLRGCLGVMGFVWERLIWWF